MVPNGTRLARCHFRAQKSLDFQCPPLSMALDMDFPPFKSLHAAPEASNSYSIRCFSGTFNLSASHWDTTPLIPLHTGKRIHLMMVHLRRHILWRTAL
jgi:hypothetical protein